MRRWTAGALVAFGCACAGAPPLPAGPLAQAEAEVRAAQEIGAERAPQAKVHLQAARESIENAREINNSDPEAAARKLEIARAQAELANALAREQLARTEAEQAHARLDALRSGPPDALVPGPTRDAGGTRR
jgi:tRNA A37 N6-isopentenylltransferase MiaA